MKLNELSSFTEKMYDNRKINNIESDTDENLDKSAFDYSSNVTAFVVGIKIPCWNTDSSIWTNHSSTEMLYFL